MAPPLFVAELFVKVASTIETMPPQLEMAPPVFPALLLSNMALAPMVIAAPLPPLKFMMAPPWEVSVSFPTNSAPVPIVTDEAVESVS